MAYEKKYHAELHNHLLNNPDYYLARSKIALEKYFKEVPKTSKVLDFGCGLGANIFQLKNASGYDISKFALAFCKSKGIKTYTDIYKIPNNYFDVVFSSHVLEHVTNPFETLKTIHKKLKKEGKLILVLPKEKEIKLTDFKLDKNGHLCCWTFRTIVNLLVRTGFKVISVRYEYGKAYKILLPFNRLNFKLYLFLTRIAARLCGSKEMIIEAIKN